MSQTVLNHLLSEGYAKRKPIFSTQRSVSASGKQTRVPNYSQALSQWTLPFQFLGEGAIGNTDFNYLEGFFEARLGDFDSFLWDDPNDDQCVAQPLLNTVANTTNGDGATLIFQMQRTLGSGTAPVYAINGAPTAFEIYWTGVGNNPAHAATYENPPINVYVNGSLVSSANYSIGTLPVLSLTLNSGGSGGTSGTFALAFAGGGGGSGATGTYTISGGVVTAVTLTAGGSGYLYPPIPSFPSGGIVGASAYCSIANGGTMLFGAGHAPGSGLPVTADFSYFRRVIFSDSMLEFENFAQAFWALKSLVLEEVPA
jgi:hypothetical protein